MIDPNDAAIEKEVAPGLVGRREGIRRILRLLLALFYFVAGFFHLYATEGFVTIVPDWVPYPHAVVVLTGFSELLGAAALLTPRFRRPAGIMLALYAVCVFPANIKHAMENIPVGGVVLGWGYHVPRLLFQPILVWLALFCGDVMTWPFHTERR